MKWWQGTIAVALLACGGHDPLGPVDSRNSGGIGNQTLEVQAEVELNPRTGGFLTEFDVEVRDRDDLPVSDAVVTIIWNNAPVTLAEDGNTGIYRAQSSGAGSGTLVLSVEKDSLYVRDVRLGNIGIQAVLEPQEDDTVPANQPLTVRWRSDTQAPVATLFTRDDSFEVLDTGEYVIPDSLNPVRSSQVITLLRSNEVQLTGGLRGSYFRMEVRTFGPSFVVSDSP